jgi:hypothetical protein
MGRDEHSCPSTREPVFCDSLNTGNPLYCTHDRSAVSRRTQAEIQVVVFTFFLLESDVFIALENENSQLYVKGSAAVHWLQVRSVSWFMFIYFQFLLHDSYCLFG